MHALRCLGTLVLAAYLVACAGPAAQPGPGTSTEVQAPQASPNRQPEPTPAAMATMPSEAPVRFAGADSIGLAAAPDGPLYAVIGDGESLYVARSDDGGASFGPLNLASGKSRALVSHFERPTIVAGPDGAVTVSWLEQQGSRTLVWLARSEDGGASFGPPEQVADSSEFETTMARLVDGAAPAVSWLQAGKLILARPDGAHFTAGVVDELACECCQPAALSDGDRLALAYRNLERGSGGDIRDLFVAVSEDGGASFAEPVRVSDSSWQVNACPISGPALAAANGRLYVAWMDGRADTEGSGLRGDLFVAVSEDGGASFGPNRRVNPEPAGYHNLPALGAGPDGRLHIAWEAEEDGNYSLYYTVSADGGASFARPERLADDAAGRPFNAAMTLGADGAVHIAWQDREGAQVRTLR